MSAARRDAQFLRSLGLHAGAFVLMLALCWAAFAIAPHERYFSLVLGPALLVLTAAAAWWARAGLDRPLPPLPLGHRRLLLALLGLALLAIAGLTLRGFANSGDEYAYLMQAWTYARGQLHVAAPDAIEFFSLHRVVTKDGIWVSQYQPGWPLALTPAAVLGLPLWIVNPLVGVALAAAFHALARLYVKPGTALVLTLIFASSAFFLLNLASYFAHGWTALWIVLFAYFGTRYLQEGDAKWAVLAGLCAGVVGFTRVFNALIILLPFFTALALTEGRRLGLIWTGFGGVPFVGLLMGFNASITGNPFLFIPEWHYPGGEPLGAASVQTLSLSMRRLTRLAHWTAPLLVVLLPLAWALLARARRLSFVDWILPATLIAFAFYGAHGGNQYGPRYYFEAWPLALITLGRGAELAMAAFPRLATPALAASTALAVMAGQFAYLPARLAEEHRIITARMDPYRLVEEKSLNNAVVLIHETGVSPERPLDARDLVQNGLEPATRQVIYALDLGERNEALRARFPDRTFYLYRQGTLTKLPEGE